METIVRFFSSFFCYLLLYCICCLCLINNKPYKYRLVVGATFAQNSLFYYYVQILFHLCSCSTFCLFLSALSGWFCLLFALFCSFFLCNVCVCFYVSPVSNTLAAGEICYKVYFLRNVFRVFCLGFSCIIPFCFAIKQLN